MPKIHPLLESLFSPLLFRHPKVIQHLWLIGIGLIASSILYLIAANWWMLPQAAKLLIPQVFLLISALSSVFFFNQTHYRQALDTFACFMLGLSLAVIGQTYQTGADSYLLFLVWALLLLPWLYRPNIGVFALLCVVSQLALSLYFKQTYLMQQNIGVYLLAMNLLLLLCFSVSMLKYPALRYGFIVFLMLMSVICMVNYIATHRANESVYLISSLLLPSALAIYFFMRQQALETTLLVLGVAVSLSILLIERTGSMLNSGSGLVVLAILIFIWFAGITWALKKLLPASRFSVIPLAFGAWLSGLILASMLLTYWEAFSMLMGAVFILIAWRLLSKQSSVFLRQLAYCLWVCGQAAVLVHAYILSENWWVVCALQLGFLIFVWWTQAHWFKLALQLILAHGLAAMAWLVDSPLASVDAITLLLLLNYALFIGILLTAKYWQHSTFAQSISLWMIAILTVTAVYQCLQGLDVIGRVNHALWSDLVIFYILPAIWLGIFVRTSLRQIFEPDMLWLMLLAMVLIAFGYFEIFIVMVFLAWAIQAQNKLMQSLCFILIIFWLWMLYYNLGFSFLIKSISIFSSGLILLLMVHAFTQTVGEHGGHDEKQ